MNNNQSKITLGSDPELSIVEVSSDMVVSAIPLLKNDKHCPAIVEGKNGPMKIYADNVLVESAFPPVNSTGGLLKALKEVFQATQNILGKKYKLKPIPAHVYDASQLKEESAWAIGCNPSYDAYTLQANQPDGFSDGLRTGSFHIHIGSAKSSEFNSRLNMVKLLDAIVGTSSIILSTDNSSPKRRALYGQAGEHRPTPYGVEWRVLDNFALNSPKLATILLNLIDHAIFLFENGQEKSILNKVNENEIRKAINTSNKDTCADILSRLSLPKSLIKPVFKNHKTTHFNEAWGIS